MFDNVSNLMNTLQNPKKSMNLESILKTSEIPSDVQKQLIQTYTVLLVALVMTSIGILFHLWIPLGGFLTLLLSFIPLFYLTCEKDKSDLMKRSIILFLFGFLQGLSLGPLISIGLNIDPFLVFLSFLCTAVIFGSFSLAAIVATRRSYLYLGGFLSSAMAVVAIISIANLLVQSVHFYLFHLYAGLFIFSGFVIVDTQMIIERACNGDKDVVGHALHLFLDFLSIFARVMIILLRNKRLGSNNTNPNHFQHNNNSVFSGSSSRTEFFKYEGIHSKQE